MKREFKKINGQKRFFPRVLNTPEAMRYFRKAKKAGLIDEDFHITTTYRLFAYFASKMSDKLQLAKRTMSDGDHVSAWKPFEQLFEIKRGCLKEGRKSMLKEKDTFTPKGYQIVDKIFSK